MITIEQTKLDKEDIRKQIDFLIVEREKRIYEKVSAKDVMLVIKDVMEILNDEFPTSDIKGLIFEWNRMDLTISLKTYPDEVFPNSFFGMGKEYSLMCKIRKARLKEEAAEKVFGFLKSIENARTEESEYVGVKKLVLVFKK